jgi:hypothetical protein
VRTRGHSAHTTGYASAGLMIKIAVFSSSVLLIKNYFSLASSNSSANYVIKKVFPHYNGCCNHPREHRRNVITRHVTRQFTLTAFSPSNIDFESTKLRTFALFRLVKPQIKFVELSKHSPLGCDGRRCNYPDRFRSLPTPSDFING